MRSYLKLHAPHATFLCHHDAMTYRQYFCVFEKKCIQERRGSKHPTICRIVCHYSTRTGRTPSTPFPQVTHKRLSNGTKNTAPMSNPLKRPSERKQIVISQPDYNRSVPPPNPSPRWGGRDWEGGRFARNRRSDTPCSEGLYLSPPERLH